MRLAWAQKSTKGRTILCAFCSYFFFIAVTFITPALF
jgi:hypothetical protein